MMVTLSYGDVPLLFNDVDESVIRQIEEPILSAHFVDSVLLGLDFFAVQLQMHIILLFSWVTARVLPEQFV